MADNSLLLYVRLKRRVKQFFSEPGINFFRPPITTSSHIDEIEKRITQLECQIKCIQAVPSFLSKMHAAHLSSDIQLDLIDAYMNPDQLMIDVYFPEIEAVLGARSTIAIVRSHENLSSLDRCTSVIAFRTIQQETTMDDYQQWLDRCRKALLLTESAVVIPIAVFGESDFREWFVVWKEEESNEQT